MTTQLNRVQKVADILLQARRSGIPANASSVEEVLDSAVAAYTVQEQVARALEWFDRAVPQYWKSGGPAKDQPILHVPLPPRGVFDSPADLSSVALFTPGVEAEIALRLGRDVAPQAINGAGRSDIEPFIDAMAVSIEIVDSRWVEGADAPGLLRLADQQSHGALVLSAWQPYERRNWDAQRCRIRVGVQSEVVQRGTHAYGDPAWGVLDWLRHVTRNGATVPAGTVVTTGTWCGVLPAKRGEHVVVMFEGIGSAELQL